MEIKKIILNGSWKAWPGKKAPLSDKYYSSTDAAKDWIDVNVPHNWSLDSRIANDENITYYFKNFNIDLDTKNKKFILNLENVFNSYILYVNGEKAAYIKTYFMKSKINITDYIKEGDNFLYMKVSWPFEAKEDPFLGIYKNYEYGSETQIYGGICDDVYLEIFDNCYINSLEVNYQLDINSANLSARLNTISDSDIDTKITWELTPHNFKGHSFSGNQFINIKEGNSYTQLKFRVAKVAKWWPWEQGFPSLYNLEIKIIEDDKIIAQSSIRLGFRDIKIKNRKILINGHRQFLRGVHYLPHSYYMSEINRDKLERDIQLILDAGFNCIRLFQHVPNKKFYDICNENGLLVWQDIPFNHTAKLSDDKNILKKSVQLQKKLHIHPSLIIFGTPSVFDSKFYNIDGVNKRKLLLNKIAKTFKKIDKSRLTLQSKQYLTLMRIFDWRFQNSRRFVEFKAAVERIGKTSRNASVITSYGFASYPEVATMIKMSRNLDEEAQDTWVGTSEVDKRNIRSINSQTPRRSYKRASSYYMATQYFQAKLIRFYGELWRRYKYRSYNGCFLYFFNDPELAISDSLIDYYDRPKQAYTAAKNTMQPVSIIMDWPSEYYTDGDLLDLDIYVINDTRNEFPSAILKWEIVDIQTGEVIILNRNVVDLLGDEISIGATVKWEINDKIRADEYRINLELILPTKETVKNNYRVQIE